MGWPRVNVPNLNGMLQGAGSVYGTIVGAPLRSMLGVPYEPILQQIGQQFFQQQPFQNRPVVNPGLNRPDFSGAGERARRFQEYKTGRDIPGANTDYSARLNTGVAAGSPAAERAYQQEASRVAQLTAQDPELQRYEAARLKAVAPGAAPETVQSAEDIGMQMWAKANPTLAAKVKPGQAGYDAIQGVLAGNAARSGLGFTTPQQLIPTPPPGINAPQGLPTLTSFAPTQTYGPNGTAVDPELVKKFQLLLNQSGS